jgi:ATP-dependent DNA ligase
VAKKLGMKNQPERRTTLSYEWDTGGVRPPRLVAAIEFLAWTPENHLRHSKFIALREDKKASQVRKEVGALGLSST